MPYASNRRVPKTCSTSPSHDHTFEVVSTDTTCLSSYPKPVRLSSLSNQTMIALLLVLSYKRMTNRSRYIIYASQTRVVGVVASCKKASVTAG